MAIETRAAATRAAAGGRRGGELSEEDCRASDGDGEEGERGALAALEEELTNGGGAYDAGPSLEETVGALARQVAALAALVQAKDAAPTQVAPVSSASKELVSHRSLLPIFDRAGYLKGLPQRLRAVGPARSRFEIENLPLEEEPDIKALRVQYPTSSAWNPSAQELDVAHYLTADAYLEAWQTTLGAGVEAALEVLGQCTVVEGGEEVTALDLPLPGFEGSVRSLLEQSLATVEAFANYNYTRREYYTLKIAASDPKRDPTAASIFSDHKADVYFEHRLTSGPYSGLRETSIEGVREVVKTHHKQLLKATVKAEANRTLAKGQPAGGGGAGKGTAPPAGSFPKPKSTVSTA